MYNEKIMKIFANPEHMGEIRTANAIGDAGGAVVGDILKFYMIINDDKIEDVKCKAFGSAVAIAVGSVCASLLQNKTIKQALDFDIQKVSELLGEIPAEKQHCLAYTKKAITEAINYYYKKKEKAEKEEVE